MSMYPAGDKNEPSALYGTLNQDVDKFYTLVDKFNGYNSSTWKIKPEENKCILFPSYLKHYVEPNLNKKERISISFNYGF